MKRNHLLDEIFAIILFAAGILIFLSLISYHKEDISFLTSHPNIPPKNLIRGFGAYLAFVLLFLIGWASYLLVLILGIFGLNKIRHKDFYLSPVKSAALSVAVFSLSSLLSLVFFYNKELMFKGGGFIGASFSKFTVDYFGRTGGYVIVSTLLLSSCLLLGEFLLYPILSKSKLAFLRGINNFWVFLKKIKGPVLIKLSRKEKIKEEEKDILRKPKEIAAVKDVSFSEADEALRPAAAWGVDKKAPRLSILNPENEKNKTKEKISVIKVSDGDYQLPSLDLLDEPMQVGAKKEIKEDLTENARILEETLGDFGITVRVTDIERGPTITRYELEPAPGVKVQKIVGLSDDIALIMKAQSVRIVAPIPGKSRVGIEVPNTQIGSVYFKEIIRSDEFIKSNAKLSMALGKDTAGVPIVADLGDMPHLLIAGTTGSGKTVCVNCLIVSFLFRLNPNQVKFLMVDPKMVELAVYNGLPHLLCPVVTDHKKVSSALNWVVAEMEDRYRLLAKEGVRNIEGYNAKQEKLPYIVVVIDELADLMAIAQDQIENAITRLAQLSRAVGIHLILATQRPSVDVITGVIKANFPARISFQVASKVDSRTVLDANGADKLLGKGDMLFLNPGQSKLLRLQGGYLQDKEIERVVEFIKSQAGPIYNETILKGQEKGFAYADGEKDELFDDAVRVILESNQASVSILQRRMRLGYTRAARIIDAMEGAGIVGPYQGSKPRKILVDKDTYLKQKEEDSAVTT
ncbi:MAG: DNA translocase FtsK [Candidatus Omnitrophota bacterium]|nr:DNA translocase FtsK [Candidatus Omnitrophota bacterium]